ncbi:GDP-mannose 4,6-dehydratase [Patescibacteria group bacterium]|nr:GDP-mannose 4,6-dehydratase [Patescibacteria group bacterium]
METKPKIIITGGLGFIFSHVTEYFVQKGWKVVVIDNESTGSHPEIVDGSFEYHKMSVCDREVINLIRAAAPDYVIHAAAISDVDYSLREPYKTLEENILANLNVFEACRELDSLKNFIYVSTDEVYGECEHRKKEDEIIFPRNPYACSKAVGSIMRYTYDNSYPNLLDKTSETRFCNVFGPRQDTRKILPLIKHALETDEPIPIHNGGLGYREYIYVKNIPPAIDLILEKGNRTYNLTLNDGFTVGELIQQAEKVTGKKIKVYDEHRPGMDMKYQMDASRIKDELGWKPLYTFEEGLKEYFVNGN